MDPRFHTTRWSMVLSVGEDDSEKSREALESLCATYWYPLYAHARRQGFGPETAEDLTQDFFAALLEKGWVEAADPDRGRFRAFLLMAFRRHLGRQLEEARATKRGSGRAPLSFNSKDGERIYSLEPTTDLTPERDFDRRWALTLLSCVMDHLGRALHAEGKGEQFDALQPYIGGQGSLPSYGATAERLGISEGAVKVAVHRLRARYRDLLRGAIAETVERPDDVNGEIQYLLAALSS